MSIASIFITVLYLYLLQWITLPLLYFSIFLVFAGFVATGAWSLWLSTQYPEGSEWQQYGQIGAGLAFALALIYLICVCCCWSNITLGAQIMSVAADFLTSNLRIVFLPFGTAFVVFLFMIWWLACAAWIYTVGDVQWVRNSYFTEITNNPNIHYLMWFFLFCLVWVLSFISAYQVFVTAATAVQFYFYDAAADAESQPDSQG